MERRGAQNHLEWLLGRLCALPEVQRIRVRQLAFPAAEIAGMPEAAAGAAEAMMDACWNDGLSDVDMQVELAKGCPGLETSAGMLGWLRQVGVDEENCLGFLAAEDSGACRVVFRQGFRYDITVQAPAAPDAALVADPAPCAREHPHWSRESVNRFWFVQVQALGKLYRGDYLIGRHLAHMQLNETLVMQMVQRDLEKGTNHHRYGGREAAAFQRYAGQCPVRTDEPAFDEIADGLYGAARAYDDLIRAFYPEEAPRTPVLMDIWQTYERERQTAERQPTKQSPINPCIRQATAADASRIAEILIFTKRVNYRRIFQNDQVSFGEMQVLPLAQDFLRHPDRLKELWVYDDGFVKGLVHPVGSQIAELYVDSFFAGQGIGRKLLTFAVQERGCDHLWALEKNQDALRFYQRHGFRLTGRRELQPGTPEYLVHLRR